MANEEINLKVHSSCSIMMQGEGAWSSLNLICQVLFTSMGVFILSEE